MNTATPFILAATISLAAVSVKGDWPTDPATPLIAGEITGLGTPDHSMAIAPDGATWISWVDDQCFGEVRLQRISPSGALLQQGGLSLGPFEICNTPHVHLTVGDDGSAIVAGAPNVNGDAGPIRRFDATGAPMWGDGIEPPGDAVAAAWMHVLPGGDLLVLWQEFGGMLIDRYTVAGESVWPSPQPLGVAHADVFGIHDDGAGGVYILWDGALTYTRLIRATRIDADGNVLWSDPINVHDPVPGSSRHTPPTSVEDGRGGMFVLWSQGAEQGTTPVPLRLQHIGPDGARTFEAEGRRVSLGTDRQFAPAIVRRGDDLAIAWHDGFSSQSIRAQAMTLDGTRLWGDEGVEVAVVDGPFAPSHTLQWQGEGVSVVVSDEAAGADTVHWHGITTDGVVGPIPSPLSGEVQGGPLASVAVDDAIIVSWSSGFQTGDMLAHRVNADGSVGPAQSSGDTNDDGVVDLADLLTVLASWGPCGTECPGDLNGDGTVGIADLLIVISTWS